MLPGLNLHYYADPAQPLTMTGEELHDLDHEIVDMSRGVNDSLMFLGEEGGGYSLSCMAVVR